MLKRLLLTGILLCLLNLAIAFEQPNVIVVLTDDQGYGDFGFMGNPLIRTPHLDAMAGRSAQLEQFYVSPVCAPTRASLMTGRYNYRTRAIDTWNGHAMMDADEDTIAEYLKDVGYGTGLFGKWHLGDNYPLRPQDQGFDEVLMHRGGGIGQPSDPDGAEGKYTDPVLFHNGERVSMKGYCTDIYFDAAMDWMESEHKAGRPFFAYIPTNAPHGPFHDVPDDLYQEYKKMDLRNAKFPQKVGHKMSGNENVDTRARIFAMITNVDDNMGRLFKHLDKLGIRENTLVIFLVDNGPNGNRYVAGFRGRKTMVQEGGIRSPVLLDWKGTFKTDNRVNQITAHIDLAPTILEICGVCPDETYEMDGRSLYSLLIGNEPIWPDRAIVIQAHRGKSPVLYHNFALRTQKWKLMHGSGFQKDDFEGKPVFELYDMENDPYEQKDLSAKRPEILKKLKFEYEKWFTDVSNTRPDNYDSPRILVDLEKENPVVLTRQDGEHYNGAPFRPESFGKWRVEILEQGIYSIRFRFPELEKSGKAVLKMNGEEQFENVQSGQTEHVFKNVRLKEGPLDLLPLLMVDEQLYSPWKVDISD